jgi:hypothetical protein
LWVYTVDLFSFFERLKKKTKKHGNKGPGLKKKKKKKLIMDYHFYLKSGPVFLFQIFIIAKGYKIVSLIIN